MNFKIILRICINNIESYYLNKLFCAAFDINFLNDFPSISTNPLVLQRTMSGFPTKSALLKNLDELFFS
jgi:hypothetical protein